MMDVFTPALDDIAAAFAAVGLERILQLPDFRSLERTAVDDVVAGFGRFASAQIAPLNRVGDREGSVLTPTGRVTTPTGFRDAYRAYVDAGWSAAFDPAVGGGGLPKLVTTAMEEVLTAASLAFSLCPMLTHGAVELLTEWGSDAQRERYLPRLLTGEWSGTMCLTEPDAGSDVGAVRTTAVERDGRWYVTGTKIFITWGDHDLAENIVHCVLARAPGGPEGTKGLSLFLVPARLPSAGGGVGAPNGVRVVSIEHKMGIHASPTCVLSFEEAEAELVGDVHQGMTAMFTMMNTARLAVGVEGLGVAERAYQMADAHARERQQGSRPGPDGPRRVAIAEHPDVQRMLLAMKARIAASRLLIYRTAAALDMAAHGDDAADREMAASVAAFLVPIAKAWPTGIVNDVTSDAIQVFGGAGFIEESGVAQLYRDARITSIYEGTNGIQAIDLAFRKLDLSRTGPLHRLLDEVREAAARLLEREDGPVMSKRLSEAVDALVDATSTVIDAREADRDRALAVATPFLDATAVIIGGGLLARQLMTDDGSAPGARRREAAAVYHLLHTVPQAMTTLLTLDGIARSVRMFA